MNHRFYLDDVAAYIETSPAHLLHLCKHWNIATHCDHSYIGQRRDLSQLYLSWTGVQKLARKNWAAGTPQSMASREMFINKAWKLRRNKKGEHECQDC